MGSFDQAKFLKVGLEAIRASMVIVRSFQLQQREVPTATVKEDDLTLLTIADKESGQSIEAILKPAYPDAHFQTEDVGNTTGKSPLRFLSDPVDGTKPFANKAPTSTIILGAYDDEAKKVIACIIGEPISGRIWHTSKGKKAIRTVKDQAFEYTRAINVWPGELNTSASVYLDINIGFTRGKDDKKRQILTNEQTAELYARLQTTQVGMLGSNGLHQALVANGSDRMAGAITAAIGGPWDVCGVLLVLNAGGAARAFTMSAKRQLLEKDPLDVMSYDILVIGNNQATVDQLSNILLSCQ